MTSKNLCFNLMKEDMKRRIWTVALLFLAFAFCIVIPVIYMGGVPMEDYQDYAAWLANVRSGVLEMVGGENPFVVMIMVVASVVCGVSGFSYLHNAKKVDFYHSIPVKRENLFLASYLNGILMVAVVYLLALLFAIVAATTFGVSITETFGVAMMGYFFHMAFYILLYTTVVLAMMLTGNIVIALLGTVVFFSYVPGVLALFSGYMQTWFKTFSYTDGLADRLGFLVLHSSPFSYYMLKLSKYGEESVAAAVLITLFVSVVMAAAVCLLYRIRPSEAAGRAMAFKKSMAPIKILLVMPISLAFCLFFYMLRNSFGWAVFGVLCGALIVHCLMEIIYHFDFRKLFSNKVHLAVCAVAGMLILCGFRFDIFGYDTYVPKESQVKAASIYLRSLDDWVTYGDVKMSSGGDYYHWDYQDGESYISEHMKLEHPADVITMAQQGIKYNKEHEDDYNTSYWGSYASDSDEQYIGYTVRYVLNSGRVVSRIYTASLNDVGETLRRIYDGEDYKKGAYPVLSQTAEDTVKVNFQQYNEIIGTVRDAGVAEILAVYQQELAALTYDVRGKELPIGTIQFMTKAMDDAIEGRGLVDNARSYYAGDISERCYYPVYPSFTKTLGLLKANGVNALDGLSSKNISRIEIRDDSRGWDDEYGYSYKEAEARYLNVNDPAQIDELAPALMFRHYYYMNETARWREMEYIELTITTTNDRTISCLLNEDKIPDFLSKWLEEGKTEATQNE